MIFKAMTDEALTTDQEYEYLAEQLNRKRALIFTNTELPEGCEPATASLIISRGEGFSMSLQPNVAYSGSDNHFAELCRNHGMTFRTLNEMKAFLRGMRLDSTASEKMEGDKSLDILSASMAVTDREKLLFRSKSSSDLRIKSDQLSTELRKQVIGQDRAVEHVSRLVTMHINQVHHSRPLSILLWGPTGCGKTLLAKSLGNAINQQLTDQKFNTVYVHCNELKEPHQTARIVGSPAGYIGYGDPVLLSGCNSNARQVVIFDEIEKAHPRVLEVLMTAMDDGELMLSKPVDGKSNINLKQAVFIFTSNLHLYDSNAQVGSCEGKITRISSLNSLDELRIARENMVLFGVNREIVARFTDIVRLDALDEIALVDIIMLELQKCAYRFGFSLNHVSADIVQSIYNNTDSQGFGIRSITRYIEQCFGLYFGEERREGTYDLEGTVDAPALCQSVSETISHEN